MNDWYRTVIEMINIRVQHKMMKASSLGFGSHSPETQDQASSVRVCEEHFDFTQTDCESNG